jgi:hypothetical protein
VADQLLADRVDAQRGGPRSRRHDSRHARAAEQQADAVVGRPAAGQLAAPHGGEPHRQPLGLAVRMDAEGTRQQAEALDRLQRPAGARHPAGEPAHRPGRQPGEHDPAPPRLRQQPVQLVRAPDREQVAHRAAADVDDILLEHDVRERTGRAVTAEERQVGRRGSAGEAGVEGRDLRGRVAGGGGQEQDARFGPVDERQHEVVERGIVRLHREAAAAHREDLRVAQMVADAHATARSRSARPR